MSVPKIVHLTLEQRIALEGGWMAELMKIEDEKASGRSSEHSSLPTKEGGQQETRVCGSANLDDGTIIGAVANFVKRFVFLNDPTYYTLIHKAPKGQGSFKHNREHGDRHTAPDSQEGEALAFCRGRNSAPPGAA